MMMKLILSLIFASLSSVSFAQRAGELNERNLQEQWHSQGWKNNLLLRLPMTQDGKSIDNIQTLVLINLFNEAAGYSIGVNESRYYLGTDADVSTRTDMAALSQQGLSMLSSRDLFMTRRVKEYENRKNTRFRDSTYFKYLGLQYPGEAFTSSDVSKNLGYALPDNQLKNGLVTIAPMFQDNVQVVNDDHIECKPDFMFWARDGIRRSIIESWSIYEPMTKPLLGLDQALLYLRSYTPILSSGDLFIDKSGRHKSVENHQMYFAAPGVLTTVDSNNKRLAPTAWKMNPINQVLEGDKIINLPFLKFNHISYHRLTDKSKSNLQVVKVETQKKFSETNTLHMEISFGKFDLQKPVDPKTCEIIPIKFTDPEDGLDIRGYLDLASEDPKRDPNNPQKISEESANNKFLNKIGIRMVVSRVQLELNRQASSSWEQAFENDFTFNSIKSVPESSVMHVTIFYSPKSLTIGERVKMDAIRTANWIAGSAARYITYGALGGVHDFTCENQKSGEVCSITFSTVSEASQGIMGFLKAYWNFMHNIVNDQIMKRVQQQAAGSIDSNLVQVQASMDSAISVAVSSIMEEISKTKDQILPYLARLNLPGPVTSDVLNASGGATSPEGTDGAEEIPTLLRGLIPLIKTTPEKL